ncbi:cell division cycle protein 20 homolog B-like [Aulostomus maculatus]
MCIFYGDSDIHHASYKRFRRWIIQKSNSEGPVASTPLTSGRQCDSSFVFDSVCQRLELDSTSQQHETALGNKGLDEIISDPQPFAILDEDSMSVQGKSLEKLAAPSLLNDYYTNLLDCSCNGIIALALGSTVYIWNPETRSLIGHLDSRPPLVRQPHQSVSSLCWSRDGRALCIGTRRGELQVWDVERNRTICFFSPHLSVVRALSWKQQLLSSGSVLGHIHHHDPRAPAPLVGAVFQQQGVCSLQWSSDEDWLASGSTDGLLNIWDSDIIGFSRSHQPIITMKQPSAVKAMGWCPWQRKMIATGGGWKDGQLRIWDAKSGACVTSVHTDSQICCLRWAEKKRRLITGHGLPYHQVTCWDWDFPSLNPTCHLEGHSNRVLHLAVNPDCSQLFSAGADQCFHIWAV